VREIVEDLRLVPRLRCPWCGKMAFAVDPDSFTGSLTCAKCGEAWWAIRIYGDVRANLMRDFEGDVVMVESFMTAFNLPALAPEGGAFWQLKLAGRQSHRYHKHPERGVLRTKSLLRDVIALLKPA
jgi:hypothetical protein